MLGLDFMRVFTSLLPHQFQNLISPGFSTDISYLLKIQSLFDFPCYYGIRKKDDLSTNPVLSLPMH